MENRKITIYQTKNQSKKVIMTDATTLAELKAACRENGIDYDGMTWFEGTSKVELKNDESVLPHDVPFKGQITNELVFMLTNTNKKIKSGAMTRQEAYAAIKSNNLQAAIQQKFGKNFTMCKTADLIDFIIESENTVAISSEAPKSEVSTKNTTIGNVKEALETLVTILEDNGTLEYSEYEKILDVLDGKAAPKEKESDTYSNSELEDMFGDWAN